MLYIYIYIYKDVRPLVEQRGGSYCEAFVKTWGQAYLTYRVGYEGGFDMRKRAGHVKGY